MDKSTLRLMMSLEDVVRRSLERHRQLAALLKRKREAMRQGKADDMSNLCHLENTTIQVISELEKNRLQLVGELTVMVAPDATQPLRMREMAERLPEPSRSKLLVLRSQLLDAMSEVQEQTSVARRASESLLNHMNGLIRTIGVVSNGGAAYGQTGQVRTRPAPLRTLNLTA